MRVLIAGGGTGGHLFPGIALAEEVATRHPKNEVVFVGTDAGLEARWCPPRAITLETITSRGPQGHGPAAAAARACSRCRSRFFESWRILRRYQPDVVVGVGGYAWGRWCWPRGCMRHAHRGPGAERAARASPTGSSAGSSKSVFIAFDEARRFFPEGKVQLIGNPIRRKLMDNYLRSQRGARALHRPRLRRLARAPRASTSRMVEALEHLGTEGPAALRPPDREERPRDGAQGLRATRASHAEVVEFIDDMSEAYARAELVICRAGATTLAELTVCKKASILIPFPYATDNHQEVNARRWWTAARR